MCFADNVANYPWMGARARLKASFNCGQMTTAAARIICTAMQKYGMILADNGERRLLACEVQFQPSKTVAPLHHRLQRVDQMSLALDPNTGHNEFVLSVVHGAQGETGISAEKRPLSGQLSTTKTPSM